MPAFYKQIIQYYGSLKPPDTLPAGFSVLYPQKDREVVRVLKLFYKKYYDDFRPRLLLLGINPGRFGAGVTGINFTASRQLSTYCGIAHKLHDQSERSAEFIYDMIAAYGGPECFFNDYFIGAVSPFGYLTKGVNCNYYDTPVLLKAVEPFIVESMDRLLRANLIRSICVCIGEGKNVSSLKKWNDRYGWFGEIIALAHPRFIMQYRRKQKEAYIQNYIQTLRAISERING